MPRHSFQTVKMPPGTVMWTLKNTQWHNFGIKASSGSGGKNIFLSHDRDMTITEFLTVRRERLDIFWLAGKKTFLGGTSFGTGLRVEPRERPRFRLVFLLASCRGAVKSSFSLVNSSCSSFLRVHHYYGNTTDMRIRGSFFLLAWQNVQLLPETSSSAVKCGQTFLLTEMLFSYVCHLASCNLRQSGKSELETTITIIGNNNDGDK